MNTKLLINYCYTNSKRKWETAVHLYKTKRYADCLFFCHLSLEFLLKGKVVEKSSKMFPITHDLEDLVKKSEIALSPEQKRSLAIINTFNIAGRYDDYKFSFYKKATSVFTKKYFQITKELLLWLKKN